MDRGTRMHKIIKTEDYGSCWCCEEPEHEVVEATEMVKHCMKLLVNTSEGYCSYCKVGENNRTERGSNRTKRGLKDQ